MSSKGKTIGMKEGGKPTLVPKLRFPEFREEHGWKVTKLNAISDPVIDRAIQGEREDVLSLSAEYGIVLQSEFFGKKVAGENSERYLKIMRNDFVYNDRTTKASTFGTIKRLSKHASGIVSPIYKCFRFKETENPVFWEWYFESGNHNVALADLVNEGARTGRFNISITQFLSTQVWQPSESEQRRIAECLSSVDEAIVAQARKVDALKKQKKGLMQQLFPREVETKPCLPERRFPEFRNEAMWHPSELGSIAIILKGKGISKADLDPNGSQPCIRYGELYTRYGEIISKVISRTKVPRSQLFFSEPNDVIIPSSGETKIDIAKASCVLAGGIALGGDLNVIRTKLNGIFLSYYLNGPKRLDIAKVAQGDTVVHLYPHQLEALHIAVPSIAEQQRIASCLSSLDSLISAEIQKFDTLKIYKKSLLQQLFPPSKEAEK